MHLHNVKHPSSDENKTRSQFLSMFFAGTFSTLDYSKFAKVDTILCQTILDISVTLV